MTEPDDRESLLRRRSGISQHILRKGEVFASRECRLQPIAVADEMRHFGKFGLFIHAFQANASAIRPQSTAEHRDQARLPRAVAAGECNRFARVKHETQALEDQPAAAAAGEILGVKAGRGEGSGFQASAAADAFELISFI